MTGASAAMAIIGTATGGGGGGGGGGGSGGAFTVTPTPMSVSGSYHGVSGSPQNITTASVLASITGGVAPYTYLWTQVGVSAYTWTIGAATSATSNFTALAVEAGARTDSSFKITVTDSLGATGFATISATAINNSTA